MKADYAAVADRISRLVQRARDTFGLSDAQRVERALELMVAVHGSQAARADGPYLNHTLMVCERVLDWCPQAPAAVWCAALLHDAAEDGEGTLIPALSSAQPDTRAGRVVAVGEAFGDDVERRLELLTNPELHALAEQAEEPNTRADTLRASRNELYAEHVRHAVHADPWVAAIKLADWSTNGLALDGLPPAQRERLTAKYRPVAEIFDHLLGEVDENHPLGEVASELRARIRAVW